MLKLTDVSIISKITGAPLFKPLSMTIHSGEIVGLMGKSGSGKSTLLNYILGHLDANFEATGSVELNNKPLTHTPPHLRQLGVLYQSGMLFPHLTVFENIAYGLKMKGSLAQKREIILRLLEEVGLSDFSTRSPHTLSGGQYIRVALVRTIASEPKALLLDEPFSRLDATLKEQVRTWVFSYAQQKSIPVLLVTHDEEDIKASKGTWVALRPFEH